MHREVRRVLQEERKEGKRECSCLLTYFSSPRLNFSQRRWLAQEGTYPCTSLPCETSTLNAGMFQVRAGPLFPPGITWITIPFHIWSLSTRQKSAPLRIKEVCIEFFKVLTWKVSEIVSWKHREDLKVQGASSALRDEDGRWFFLPYRWSVIM